MPRRSRRTRTVASSLALLSSGVFANPPPPPTPMRPPDVIVNRPNPAYDKKPTRTLDAGAPALVEPAPVAVNPVGPRDAGIQGERDAPPVIVNQVDPGPREPAPEPRPVRPKGKR